jgi:hypothetical protein
MEQTPSAGPRSKNAREALRAADAFGWPTLLIRVGAIAWSHCVEPMHCVRPLHGADAFGALPGRPVLRLCPGQSHLDF